MVSPTLLLLLSGLATADEPIPQVFVGAGVGLLPVCCMTGRSYGGLELDWTRTATMARAYGGVSVRAGQPSGVILVEASPLVLGEHTFGSPIVVTLGAVVPGGAVFGIGFDAGARLSVGKGEVVFTIAPRYFMQSEPVGILTWGLEHSLVMNTHVGYRHTALHDERRYHRPQERFGAH